MCVEHFFFFFASGGWDNQAALPSLLIPELVYCIKVVIKILFKFLFRGDLNILYQFRVSYLKFSIPQMGFDPFPSEYIPDTCRRTSQFNLYSQNIQIGNYFYLLRTVLET